MISNRIKAFIENYKLTGTFIVTFSGGYDSMCLLDVLQKLGCNLVAVHLNHNWRGKESLLEAKNCQDFALNRKIKFYTETLSDTIEKTETAAREARYDFFKRCAEKFNSNVVFTAHNFDDNAETILYRIIKGTGSVGLQGIAPKRDIFFRPLLTTKRSEIEEYCKKNNLTPNIDSSNENIKYKRNLIRKKILPLMREINPNVTEALNSLSEIAKEENQLLEQYLSKNLLTANKIEQKRLIHNLLKSNNIEYDKKKVTDIQTFINENKASKSGKKMSLTTDLWLFVNKKNIEIITKSQNKNTEIAVTKEGVYNFENFIFSITPFDKKIDNFPKDREFRAFVKFDEINFVLRHRKSGDIIQPYGTNGFQKLKKYLNEKKIPQHNKDDLIFLSDNNEILWAAGLGISDKIKVTDKPTHLIELKESHG